MMSERETELFRVLRTSAVRYDLATIERIIRAYRQIERAEREFDTIAGEIAA